MYASHSVTRLQCMHSIDLFTHSAAADSIVYVAPWSRLVHTIPPDVSVETTLPLMM